MLKYSVDEAGNVLLTCCIPAGLDHFDAPLVVAILNQIQGHLSAVYPTIMEKLWKNKDLEWYFYTRRNRYEETSYLYDGGCCFDGDYGTG